MLEFRMLIFRVYRQALLCLKRDATHLFSLYLATYDTTLPNVDNEKERKKEKREREREKENKSRRERRRKVERDMSIEGEIERELEMARE